MGSIVPRNPGELHRERCIHRAGRPFRKSDFTYQQHQRAICSWMLTSPRRPGHGILAGHGEATNAGTSSLLRAGTRHPLAYAAAAARSSRPSATALSSHPTHLWYCARAAPTLHRGKVEEPSNEIRYLSIHRYQVPAVMGRRADKSVLQVQPTDGYWLEQYAHPVSSNRGGPHL
jgi:hypothetical protein